MAVKLSPVFQDAQLDSSGNPYVGAQLFTYAAGSTTKQTVYQDSAGNTQHTNPIVLNSRGEPPAPIWLTEGSSYKFYLTTPTDTDPPVTSVRVIDNIRGVNDTSVTIDEWVASGLTPTYVSSTSFTLAGDQTTEFHEGRRLKITDSGGTKYVTITGSAYAASTTVTVAGDALASPTTAVSYGIIRANNPSVSSEAVYRKGTAVTSAATCDIWNTQGDFIHITGSTGPITSFGTAPYAGAEKTLIFDSTPGITYNATSMIINGGASVTMAAGDRAVVRADTTSNMVVSIVRAAGIPLVTPLPRSYLSGCALSNNGSDATNDVDIAAGVCRDSTNTANITVSALTKQLDANWAAGTNAGGRYSGAAIANTTYGVWAVSKADGTQDIYFYPNSTSPSASTVLTALQAESGGSSYIYARRIGFILRESAAIVAFSQNGDEFLRNASVLDVNANNPGTSAVSRTLSVPLGTKVMAMVNWVVANTGGVVNAATYISSLDQSDEAPSATVAPLASTIGVTTTSGASGSGSAVLITRTNTSGQVRSRLIGSDANTTLRGATLGWIDRRGRDD